MSNKIFYIILFAVLLAAGCEEVYRPNLETVPGSLVVESRITNDPTQNYVRLSLSRSFYSTDAVEWATGAHVELVEAGGSIIQAIEGASGSYVFTDLPVPGKSYSLRISWKTNVYESDFSKMPPVPTIDSIYTKHYIQKRYRTNAYGVPEMYETPGRQILVDAPLSTDLEYYLFDYQAVIQWVYSKVPGLDSIPSPIVDEETNEENPRDTVLYGWITHTKTDEFNLAGPKEFSTSESLQSHLVEWFDYRGGIYLDSTTQKPYNWIFTLDQFGITKASYDFYTKVNQQFEANGNLFDPVISQVESNIHCVNDASQKVLGFFNLCSYSRYRYYINFGSGLDRTVIMRRLNYFYDIPYRGYLMFKKPVFWETDYPK